MAHQFLFPRAEYPRPDKQRGTLDGFDWLNVNGPWQFRFDPKCKGVTQNWFNPHSPQWREQIIVPFCWESLAAWGQGDAAGDDNYYSTRVFVNPLNVNTANHRSAQRYEVGWYRRTVEIPANASWENKRVILHIGAADFFTDCWCNGIALGHHEGGYTPFEFDLTEALVEEDGKRIAHIILRVEDPMDNKEQPVGKQWGWYTTTSGIWQTVFIEPRASIHIRSFRVFTDIDAGTARFVIHCAHATPGCQVALSITAEGCDTQTELVDVRHGIVEKTIKLSQLKLWEPNSPFLYGLELRLRQDEHVWDTIRSYFGMRRIDYEIPQKPGASSVLRLNGIPRFLRGALYQSFYPDGVYTASSVEVLQNDIDQAKKFGFNFLRIHIKIDDPLLIFYADKLGMLLMADFPNFGEGGDTPLSRKRFELMMHEAIERDFNHPSIFAWCLFNETWGFGGQTGFIEQLLARPKREKIGSAIDANAALAPVPSSNAKKRPIGDRAGMSAPSEWVQDMWQLVKQLDPTRLVEDMSVCHWDHLEYYLHCDTDINSWHFYESDYEKAKAHIAKIVGLTFVGSTFNYVSGFKHRGQPLINSEYGGVGALDGDRDVSWSFKFLTNELRRHPQICAYIYTELHDVEWERNGMLNYDRTPKEFGYDPRIINESNTLPIDAPPISRLAPGEAVELDISSSHFSKAKYENILLRWSLAGIDTCGQFHQDRATGFVPIPFTHLDVAHAHTLELVMPQTPMLCTLLLKAQTPEGKTIAENFIHYLAASGYPPLREETSRALILRMMPSQWHRAQWSGKVCTPQEADTQDACYGQGEGFFEWVVPLKGVDIAKAHRVRVVCEASSRRCDIPQTDTNIFPTTLKMMLNGIPVYQATLPNHPHDSRGVLSYLRGAPGAYGYPAYAFIEGDLLHEVASKITDDSLTLWCGVPAEAMAKGGLTLYGAECGRFPICPTIIIDWY